MDLGLLDELAAITSVLALLGDGARSFVAFAHKPAFPPVSASLKDSSSAHGDETGDMK